MSNNIINRDLVIKINSFFKNAKNIGYLEPTIFERIDSLKQIEDIQFSDYYLDYIRSLPKCDFETATRISREVYQSYSKESEFDEILNRLINNYSFDNGSLNNDDDNCITKASESRILLSGTYYDVILICHEIGHKLRSQTKTSDSNVMDGFFFETPSILMELSANDYLRDNYGIDINADELRKKHISSMQRENGIDSNIFQSIVNLIKQKKLNAVNLYLEFFRNPDCVEHLCNQGNSIESCCEEGMSNYSYDIGLILGNHIKKCKNRNELLNLILYYKDNGLTMPFSIDDGIIQESLGTQKYTK